MKTKIDRDRALSKWSTGGSLIFLLWLVVTLLGMFGQSVH